MSEKIYTPVYEAEFDQFSCKHWDEIKAGKVDLTKSWVAVDEENQEGDRRLTVFVDREKQLVIHAFRDQWGTFITFKIGEQGFTVAQEDGTMSFMTALVSALEKLRNLTDYDTTAPTEKDFQK